MSHRAASFARMIQRQGHVVTVRHSVGSFDVVTSTRTETGMLEVTTRAIRDRRKHLSKEGGALLTEEIVYIVPQSPFCGMFEPQDSDVVIDGTIESRVQLVEPLDEGGRVVAYELRVDGADLGP